MSQKKITSSPRMVQSKLTFGLGAKKSTTKKVEKSPEKEIDEEKKSNEKTSSQLLVPGADVDMKEDTSAVPSENSEDIKLGETTSPTKDRLDRKRKRIGVIDDDEDETKTAYEDPIKVMNEHKDTVKRLKEKESPLKEGENKMIDLTTLPVSASQGSSSTKASTSKASTSKQSVGKHSLRKSTGIKYKDRSTLRKLSDPKYNPTTDAPFAAGEPVPFSFLVEGFEEVGACHGENSKEAIKVIMSNIFRSVITLTPEEMVICYYLSTGKLAPDYRGVEIGVGFEILRSCTAKATGRSDKEIRQEFSSQGDLGEVVESCKSTQKSLSGFFIKKGPPTVLTCSEVFEDAMKVANTSGQNSTKLKQSIILRLLKDGTNTEAKYVIRFFQKNLKIGANAATMIGALAKTVVLLNKTNLKFTKSEKQVEEVLNMAFTQFPDQEFIITKMIESLEDIDQLLEQCGIRPGIPVKPMLAKPTKGIKVILKRFEELAFTCEYKYDGFRGQIHMLKDGSVQIYSRNSENMTGIYPDVVKFFQDAAYPGVEEFILDSEIVPIDPETEKILPFQQLTTRSRKNVDINNITVNVCLFPFDLLYFNGESLLSQCLEERREVLWKNFTEVSGKLRFAKYLNSDNVDDIQVFLEESIRDHCEGLMVKTLKQQARYEPSKRSFSWLKLKKDYIDSGDNICDSLDLVPIGAFMGTGKRTGTYGCFLMAVYNDEFERFETVTKVATGFSDDDLKKFHEFFKDHVIPKPRSDYMIGGAQAEVWFEPVTVWELRAADFSISPIYMGAVGEVDNKKGIALRFPRFIRVRDDKSPTDATNSAQLADMYKSQPTVNYNFDDNDLDL